MTRVQPKRDIRRGEPPRAVWDHHIGWQDVGIPENLERLPQDYLEKRALAAGRINYTGKLPPEWLAAEVASGKSIEDIVDILLERLQSSSREVSAFREAGFIVNELSRMHGGKQLLQRVFTDDVIKDFRR
jgi:hypothetical protein